MKKSLIASVLMMAGFAFADDTVSISINRTALEGFVKDLKEYSQTPGSQQIVGSVADVVQSLDNAFKNTYGKMVINYGKYYGPAIENFGKFSK